MIICVGYIEPNMSMEYINNLNKDETLTLTFLGYEQDTKFNEILINDMDDDSLKALKNIFELKQVPRNILILNYQDIDNESMWEKRKKNSIYNILLKIHSKHNCNLIFLFHSQINFGLMEDPRLENLNNHAHMFIFYDENGIEYTKSFDNNGKVCYNILENK